MDVGEIGSDGDPISRSRRKELSAGRGKNKSEQRPSNRSPFPSEHAPNPIRTASNLRSPRKAHPVRSCVCYFLAPRIDFMTILFYNIRKYVKIMTQSGDGWE